MARHYWKGSEMKQLIGKPDGYTWRQWFKEKGYGEMKPKTVLMALWKYRKSAGLPVGEFKPNNRLFPVQHKQTV